MLFSAHLLPDLKSDIVCPPGCRVIGTRLEFSSQGPMLTLHPCFARTRCVQAHVLGDWSFRVKYHGDTLVIRKKKKKILFEF